MQGKDLDLRLLRDSHLVQGGHQPLGAEPLEVLGGFPQIGHAPIAPRAREWKSIIKLRRLRFTPASIAETLEMPLSTASGILIRCGVGRLGRLGLEQPVRGIQLLESHVWGHPLG